MCVREREKEIGMYVRKTKRKCMCVCLKGWGREMCWRKNEISVLDGIFAKKGKSRFAHNRAMRVCV